MSQQLSTQSNYHIGEAQMNNVDPFEKTASAQPRDPDTKKKLHTKVVTIPHKTAKRYNERRLKIPKEKSN